MARRANDPQLEQLWRQRIERWQAGGQSAREFCTSEAVPESAFYFWRRTIAERDGSTKPRRRRARSPAPFVPMTIVAAATVEVRCPSGHVVTLPTADIDTLRQLFAALAPVPSC
jgi:hypothetical protein